MISVVWAGGKGCVIGAGNNTWEDTNCSLRDAAVPGSCVRTWWAKGDYCAPLKGGGDCIDDTRQTQIYRQYSNCVFIGSQGDLNGGPPVQIVCSTSEQGPVLAIAGDTANKGICKQS